MEGNWGQLKKTGGIRKGLKRAKGRKERVKKGIS